MNRIEKVTQVGALSAFPIGFASGVKLWAVPDRGQIED